MRTIFAQLETQVLGWLTSPAVLRTLLTDARRLAPVLLVDGRALVTTHADVLEVLESPAFSVEPIYAAKMERTSGAFFLGMDPGPDRDREVSKVRRAVGPNDVETVRAIARQTAEDVVERARARGALDAVAEFSRVIPMRIIQTYFGVPGPNDDDLKRWMRTIFWEIFLNLNDDPAVAAAADRSSRELGAYLGTLMSNRKSDLAAGGKRDDFLSRLLLQQSDPAMGLDDDGVRRNIGGIVVGALDTQSKAMAQALEQLLIRPEALAIATCAAREGDDGLLSAAVFEALRFNPQNPILIRHCLDDHVIGQGTYREHRIPGGTTVYAATLGAMFDPEKFPDPDAFRVDRPWDDYIHFGRAPHLCFGERFNRVVLPEALKALLRLPGLRLAQAGEHIEYEGPFPDHMMLRFDAEP